MSSWPSEESSVTYLTALRLRTEVPFFPGTQNEMTRDVNWPLVRALGEDLDGALRGLGESEHFAEDLGFEGEGPGAVVGVLPAP